MVLDLTGQPWIDLEPEAFERRLEEGRFDPWRDQARQLHRDGFCLLDLADPDLLACCDAVIEGLSPRMAAELQHWREGLGGPPRLQDGWQNHPEIRAIALHPAILDLLRRLYGREPFAFQTLNFAVGSQQHVHSDAIHFHSYPHGFMCGVWVALQDIEPASGPLQYYPASHRLPYHSAASLGLDASQVAAEPHPQRFFEPLWRQALQDSSLDQCRFLPRRGQALIWHANLLHGGSPVADRTSTRWSQVTHYFFEGCLYTTPLKSFDQEHGGPCLRNPFDIARGARRFTESEWRALGGA